MLTKRIIPCLDCDLQVPEGRVVKGVEFKQIKYAGNPVDLATRYYEEGADEVVVLDITASHERRATMADVIDRLTENVFMPICCLSRKFFCTFQVLPCLTFFFWQSF